MFRRTPTAVVVALVLTLCTACGNDPTPSASRSKRTTTTSANTRPTSSAPDPTTTTTAAPATTTTVVLHLPDSVSQAIREKVQLAWASLRAAFTDFEQAASIPDPDLMRRSPYLHGSEADVFVAFVARLRDQGLVSEFPPGSFQLTFEGFQLETWGMTIYACEHDSSVQRRRADGIIVDDKVRHEYTQQQLIFTDGMWKLDGRGMSSEGANPCAPA